MADDENSPLLASAKGKAPAGYAHESGETTPLLSSSSDTPRYDGELDDPASADALSSRPRRSDAQSAKRPRRWPSFVAMGILGVIVVAIIVVAFIVPDAVQEYAKKAAVIEPTNLSLESITTNGVRARIQANFRLEGSRVENAHVRRIGRAATWVANQIGTQETDVAVYIPDYGDALLGSAVVPPLVINLRDGSTTSFDFVAEISPGDVEAFRAIANEWLEGRLDSLRLKGKTDLTLNSGLLPLGTHSVVQTLVFQANNIPGMPKYNITRLNVKDVPAPGNTKAMVADVSLAAYNQWPVEVQVPELAFEILVPGCSSADPYIFVADAITSQTFVKPRSDVQVDVHGLVRELPKSLTHVCPNSQYSPLDLLLEQYMHGDPATLFVRGSSQPDGSTPRWIADLLASVTLPVPFPGRSLDGLLRNFSLTNVHFTLPDPYAEPGDPAADPKVSGNILVTAGVPSEMNFGINVTRVRAFADVLYKSEKLGELNLKNWQHANSTRVEAEDGKEATLKIESVINDAPLNVTNADVFSEVVQTLFLGGRPVRLDIKALVDITVETVLGQLVLKGVPAEGRIPVKPFSSGKDSRAELAPKIRSLKILDTTSTSITLQALVNITNPTPYTAHVPLAHVLISHNHSILGAVTAQGLDVVKGQNTDLLVTAKWEPKGEEGRRVGRDLLSQYISGLNTSITIMTGQDCIPGQRALCEALSKFNVTVAAPKLDMPDDSAPAGQPHFIKDATFHLFSSTATFTLVSPLHYNTIYIEHINATALWNHTEPIGKIVHDLPFSAPPGESQTPKLPVDWSVGSIGYDAARKALGGKLKLDARATVGIRLGNYRETVWYIGHGIGAGVQL